MLEAKDVISGLVGGTHQKQLGKESQIQGLTSGIRPGVSAA
jgi:hypothetical protein